GGDVETVDERAPGARRDDAREEPDRRGLAGPVRPEEAHDLAALDGERHAVDGGAGAEPFGQVLGDDHPTASRSGTRSTRRRRSVRKRGFRIFTQAGTITRPPNVFKR